MIGERVLVAAGVVAIAFLVGLGLGALHSERRFEAGKAAVQAKWDKSKLAQASAVAKAQGDAARVTSGMQAKADDAAQKYEEMTHAQAPSVADSVAAGVAAGTTRLRDVTACANGGGVSIAAVDSRAADAAATQALADRVAASIAAVRAGDAADARERQLDAQVTTLQSILSAERANEPRTSP